MHDALVAAGYDRTFDELAADGPAAVPAAGAAAASASTATGSSSTPASGSTSAASARATPPSAPRDPRDRRPVPRERRRRHRDPRRRLAGRRRDRPDARARRAAALATSGRDRRRWRRGGRELHHLIDPRPGAPADGDLLRVTVVAARRRRGRGRGEVALPAGGERQPRPTPRLPSCSSPTTAARRSSEASHEARPDLLAPRARERLDRVRAADALGARRPRRQVAPVRPRGEDGVRHGRRTASSSLLALGMLALHGVTLVLDTTVHIAARARCSCPVSPLPARSRSRSASSPPSSTALDRRLVLAPPPDRRAQLAPPALGDLPRLRLGTAHGLAAGTDSSRPWALGLYLGAVGAVAFATAWRALARPIRPSRRKEHHDVSHRDRPFPLQRLRRLRRARARRLRARRERQGDACASARVDDPAVLDAAAACPMGAIRVIEEEAA